MSSKEKTSLESEGGLGAYARARRSLMRRARAGFFCVFGVDVEACDPATSGSSNWHLRRTEYRHRVHSGNGWADGHPACLLVCGDADVAVDRAQRACVRRFTAIIPLAVRPRQRLLQASPRWRGFLESVRLADFSSSLG